MTPEGLKKIVEATDKLPVKVIYEDLFQPGLKKAGEALGTLVEFGTIPFLPLKLLNARANLLFGKNIVRYERKLEKIQNEPTIQVPEYIGIPILEKFTYLNNNVLSEAFANLLAKASFESTLGIVHPRLLSILDNLSADEAKLLVEIKDLEQIPFLDLNVIQVPNLSKDYSFLSTPKQEITLGLLNSIEQCVNVQAAYNLTGLEHKVNLDFPENIDLYIENLEFNGLIRFVRNKNSLSDTNTYNKLESDFYATSIEEFKKDVKEIEAEMGDNFTYKAEIQYGYFHFTEIGKLFLKACINDIEEI